MSEELGRYDMTSAPDVARAERHEDRARVLADSLRRYLIGLHAGGILVVVWFAANTVNTVRGAFDTIRGPVIVFALGLIATMLNAQIVRYKEMRERDAAMAGGPRPIYAWFLHGWLWEWASMALFFAGVLCALAQWS